MSATFPLTVNWPILSGNTKGRTGQMPDSGPLDKFFEGGGMTIKEVVDTMDDDDPSAA